MWRECNFLIESALLFNNAVFSLLSSHDWLLAFLEFNEKMPMIIEAEVMNIRFFLDRFGLVVIPVHLYESDGVFFPNQ